MELQGKKAFFLGDSITEGVGVSCRENIYHQLIKAKHGLADAVNYGVSGSRIAKQLDHPDEVADGNFCYRARQMAKDADIIVILGGTNDYGHGNAPFGTFADRDRTTFCGALHDLYRYLVETYPEAVIAVCTPTHRGEEDTPDMKGKVLRDYVEAIRQTAEYYSLPVIDLFAMSGMQPDLPVNREKYMPDALHPNDQGHVLMADRIANFLLSY